MNFSILAAIYSHSNATCLKELTITSVDKLFQASLTYCTTWTLVGARWLPPLVNVFSPSFCQTSYNSWYLCLKNLFQHTSAACGFSINSYTSTLKHFYLNYSCTPSRNKCNIYSLTRSLILHCLSTMSFIWVPTKKPSGVVSSWATWLQPFDSSRFIHPAIVWTL